MPGKSAGQGLSDTNPEGLERHSDTEEVTGSNPVRPTPFFENLSSAESPNESQRPGVLPLRCWSEHPRLRSDWETLSGLASSAQDPSSCSGSHSGAVDVTDSEGQRASHRTERRLGVPCARLGYEGLSAQISWFCAVAGLPSLVALLLWAPLALWRRLSCASSAGARRRRAVPGDATAPDCPRTGWRDRRSSQPDPPMLGTRLLDSRRRWAGQLAAQPPRGFRQHRVGGVLAGERCSRRTLRREFGCGVERTGAQPVVLPVRVRIVQQLVQPRPGGAAAGRGGSREKRPAPSSSMSGSTSSSSRAAVLRPSSSSSVSTANAGRSRPGVEDGKLAHHATDAHTHAAVGADHLHLAVLDHE